SRCKLQKFLAKPFVPSGDEDHLERLLDLAEFRYNFPWLAFSRPPKIDQEDRQIIQQSQARAQRGPIGTRHERRVYQDSAFQDLFRRHAHASDLGRDLAGVRYEKIHLRLSPGPLKGESLRAHKGIAGAELALVVDGNLAQPDFRGHDDVGCESFDVPAQRTRSAAVKPPGVAGFALKLMA